ncbi:MAG: hypothetical protein EBS53_06070 [Bacteroidetes bacterium]|nr:hypothetical protein [Bacteroidota bacterium]
MDGGSFGNVVFVGGAGQSNPLGKVQVVSANNLTVAAMQASSFQQSAGYGQTTFNGPQNYSVSKGESLGLGVTTLGNIAVAAASITTGNGGTVMLNAGQRIDIGSGGDISADGVVTLTAGSGITTGGDIVTSGDAVQFNSSVLLASDLMIDTRGSTTVGNVTFSSTVDGPYGLEIFAGQVVDKVAVVTFTGSVGAINSLVDLDVKAESIQLNGSTYRIDGLNPELNPTATFDGAVILGVDAVFDLSGVTADNSLSFLGTLNSDGTARSMQITAGSGQLRFDGSVGSDAALKDFFVTSAGSWASTGVINLTAGTVTINAIQVANSDVGVSIQASGLVKIFSNIGTSGAPLASLSIAGSSIAFGGTEIRTTGQLNLGTSIYTTPDVEGPGRNLALLATTGDITATGLIDTRGRTGLSQQNGGDVTITTSGNISVADINTSAGTGKDAGLISIDSGNSKTITLKGTLTATGGRNGSAVIFNDDVSLGAATSILTGGTTGTSGDITFAETLGGAQSLTLNSGSAGITFSKAVSVSSLTATSAGSVEINGTVTMAGTGTVGLTADTINLSAALSSVSGAIRMTADTINLSAALSSVSGDITLKPLTSGLEMSISDSSALGLVLSKSETAQIATSGRVTFGGTSAGSIELAGTAATNFGYDVSFQTSGAIHLNGNLNAGSNTVTLGSNLALTTPATITAGIIQISGLSITGSDFTLNAPEVDVTTTVGSDVTISSNLLFPQNTSLSGVGRNINFAGTLNSSGGQRNLVITAGTRGDITFAQSLGAVVSFGNILVQGQDVGLGAGASIRGRSVTVDSGSFLNRAGGSALVSTDGRTLVFSANPNGNSPTTLNGGIRGLVPVFNQPSQIQITGAGAFTVGNSLPGGSLAVYQAQLADVLPVADLFQITDQQAYLAAVPMPGVTLPRPYFGEVLIARSGESGVSDMKTVNQSNPQSSGDFGGKAKQTKPLTRLPTSVDIRRNDATSIKGVSKNENHVKGQLSYSQYSQSFNSLSQ